MYLERIYFSRAGVRGQTFIKKNYLSCKLSCYLNITFSFLRKGSGLLPCHTSKEFSQVIWPFFLSMASRADCSYSFGSLCYRCTSIMLGRRSSYLIDLLLCYSTIFICSCSCVIQQIFTLPLCPRKHWETSVFI